MPGASHRPPPFARRLAVTLGTVVFVALAALVLYVGRVLVLFTFAGAIGAVLLSGAAQWVAGRTGLPRGVALGLTVFALLVLGVAFWWVIGPQVVTQAVELEERIPDGIAEVEAWLAQYPWGQLVLNEVPAPSDVLSGDGGVVHRITGAFATVADILVNLLVVLTVAVYGAASPDLYVRNGLKLLPRERQARGEEVLGALAQALRAWFLGQLIAMTFVGVVTAVGLFLLRVPLALSLGLLAGLLEFIPYLGPFLTAVPVMLVALLEGPQTVLYVGLFLIALQQVESYVVTPMAQRYAVSMPPALLIVGQVLFGLLFGFIGLVLAAPALVCVVVLVQMLYVEDVLGREAEVLGSEEDA